MNAIVTGASRGLGAAIARALSERGWGLVLDARDPIDLESFAESLPGPSIAIPGDVTDPAHRAALTDAARSVDGLDLLVNNASALGPSPQPLLAGYPLDELRRVYEVNVFAPLSLVQSVLPLLQASPRPIVVDVTSDAAVEGYEGWGGYGSSKAALDQLTNVLSAEQPALRIYSFDPGDMRTRMHQEAFPGEDISDRPKPEELALPAFLRLVDSLPSSGRYRAADLLSPEPV